jgi:hypothetical protein
MGTFVSELWVIRSRFAEGFHRADKLSTIDDSGSARHPARRYPDGTDKAGAQR